MTEMIELTYTPKGTDMDTEAVERALVATGMKRVTFGTNGPESFFAHSYWPDGDVVHGTSCYGSAPTLAAAFAEMQDKIEIAKVEVNKIRTAAEMRDAVLKIVPADCREAIEALPVAA